MATADPPLGSPVETLVRAAARWPDVTALVADDRVLCYGAYRDAAAGLAARLSAAGVADRPMVIGLGNSLPMAVAIYAGHAAGAQVCTVNPDYTAREWHHILTDAAPAVIVTDTRSAGVLGPEAAALQVPIWVVPDDPGPWLDELIGDGRDVPLAVPRGDRLATLQYTGGTSGRPKGVELTHAAIARNIEQREAVLPTLAGDERILCVMPLFHVFAVSMCLHLSAHCGGSLVLLPRYRPDWVVTALADHRITRFPAGPTVFNGLLAFDGMTPAATGSLRCCYSGSAPLSASTLSRWEALTGVPIYEGYGQTEAGPILTYHGPGTALKQGSVGRALPETDIQIVDPGDPERLLPTGEAGEIRARGPQIMRGYRHLPEATAEALRDGWLYTGDIGRLDADGYLFIEDRKKDMVITGGFNVYPREVDEVLSSHPAVAEAAVVGVPDAYRGEILRAVVVLHAAGEADVERLAEHCAQQLVRYKRPARIDIWEALPKTTVGKIDKKAIRQQFMDDAHVS